MAYDKGGGASAFGPFKPAYEAAAEHALKYYGGDSQWQVAFDMDEYPLTPADLEPGALCRAVAAFSATHPDVSELSLKNFVVVGPNDKSVPWIMECGAASRHRGGVVGLVGRSRGVVVSHATLPRRRYTRKTKDPMNNLDKPIYRTNAVRKWAFHHNSLKTGRSKDLPPEKLHFNHFWGARMFGWGDAIPESLLAKTIEYDDAKELAPRVRAWTAVRRQRLGSEAVAAAAPGSLS